MVLSKLFTQDASAFFSDTAHVQAMLDFEAALARAEAKTGIIPKAAAKIISAACVVEAIDLAALEQGTAIAGNPTIPLVKQLTQAVKKKSEDAARFVHWGATSQDVIDTGAILQIARAQEWLDGVLTRMEKSLAKLARTHRGTLIAGRTLMQHAVPQSFGLKAAGWFDSVHYAHARVNEAAANLRVLQFGGAAGTLASLGKDGMKIGVALAAELNLALPAAPFHARRERMADFACALGLLAGVLGKMARDLSLMSATESGEAFEPAAEGKGGSSTMPHKRNPVACNIALSAANNAPHLVGAMLSAMVQEHERGVGGWHAEWRTLPELFRIVGGSAAHMADAAHGMEIDVKRMRANVELTGGLLLAEALSFALAEKLGKAQAHALVEEASKKAVAQKKHLRDIVGAMPEIAKQFDKAALARIFDPAHYLGAAPEFLERLLSPKKTKR